MHGVVGTALGGVCTIVGEPQNLLIANVAGWEFIEFMIKDGSNHCSGFCCWYDHLLLQLRNFISLVLVIICHLELKTCSMNITVMKPPKEPK